MYANVPAGPMPPDSIYAIIEIAANSQPIKYEINKDMQRLFVDRFMPTPMFYPVNYGYINKTMAKDGDPLDVLVHTPYPILPGAIICCRPIGVLCMEDEAGDDPKIIAVPEQKVCAEYGAINDIHDLPLALRDQIKHFFMHYKDLEPTKWVKVAGFLGQEEAKVAITQAVSLFLQQKAPTP